MVRAGPGPRHASPGWSWTTACHHCPTSNIHSYTHMGGARERIFMNCDYTEWSGQGVSRDERVLDRQLRGESTYSVLADVIKHRSKQTREERVYFSLSLYSHSPSWRAVRAGARGRNLEAGTRAEAMECCLAACSSGLVSYFS